VKPVVLVTGSDLVPDQALIPLQEAGLVVRRIRVDTLSAPELHRVLKGVAGYVIGGAEKPLAEHFERADALRVVVFTGTDFRAHVPGWRRAVELGIKMESCPGTNATAVAESTIMLMLSMARPAIRASLCQAGQDPFSGSFGNIELRGRTLGLVGFGRVGSQVAMIGACGLGMEVVYHSPRPHRSHLDIPAAPVSIEELLERSDVLSLHRPALAKHEPATLGRAEFARMRDGAVVIDTAHPSLIDPVALGWAIEAKRIRAAIEGVCRESDWSALASLGPSRFFAFPSLSYNTVEANLATAEQAVRKVRIALSMGEAPRASI
jgi:D-3-phosphoglycerate dehydrogenase / 2-oxoglutarate reductase